VNIAIKGNELIIIGVKVLPTEATVPLHVCYIEMNRGLRNRHITSRIFELITLIMQAFFLSYFLFLAFVDFRKRGRAEETINSRPNFKTQWISHATPVLSPFSTPVVKSNIFASRGPILLSFAIKPFFSSSVSL
jgi:hypothetical protein